MQKRNKKISLIILFSIVCILIITGFLLQTQCNVIFITWNLSLEQSEQNFNKYEKLIKTAAESRGYTMEKWGYQKTEERLEVLFDLKKKNKYNLTLSVANDSGRENFSVLYSGTYKNDRKFERFDFDLYIDVVNSVSGKEISKDDIEKVFRLFSDGKLYKEDFSEYPLNFLSNWTLSYWVEYPQHENLQISGLTLGAIGKSIELQSSV